MKRKRLIIGALVTFVGVCSLIVKNLVFGSIWVPPNIKHLTSKAHTVCKGRVLEVTNEGEIIKGTYNGSITLRKMSSRFQVDRVFKGESNSRIIDIEYFALPDTGYITNGGGGSNRARSICRTCLTQG
jgi:hypothetical protein